MVFDKHFTLIFTELSRLDNGRSAKLVQTTATVFEFPKRRTVDAGPGRNRKISIFVSLVAGDLGADIL